MIGGFWQILPILKQAEQTYPIYEATASLI